MDSLSLQHLPQAVQRYGQARRLMMRGRVSQIAQGITQHGAITGARRHHATYDPPCRKSLCPEKLVASQR